MNMPTTMNTQPSRLRSEKSWAAVGALPEPPVAAAWAYRPGKLEGGRHAQRTGAASARSIGAWRRRAGPAGGRP